MRKKRVVIVVVLVVVLLAVCVFAIPALMPGLMDAIRSMHRIPQH